MHLMKLMRCFYKNEVTVSHYNRDNLIIQISVPTRIIVNLNFETIHETLKDSEHICFLFIYFFKCFTGLA